MRNRPKRLRRNPELYKLDAKVAPKGSLTEPPKGSLTEPPKGAVSL